jgi:hypothetical protein
MSKPQKKLEFSLKHLHDKHQISAAAGLLALLVQKYRSDAQKSLHEKHHLSCTPHLKLLAPCEPPISKKKKRSNLIKKEIEGSCDLG